MVLWRSRRRQMMLTSLAMLLPACANAGTSSFDASNEEPSPSVTVFAPSPSPYPSDWRSTLDEATAKATFSVKVPDTVLANRGDLEAVFLYPDAQAVVMQFPLASPPKEPINSDHIEVWEGAWTLGDDPSAVFQEDLQTYQIAGESVFEVAGLPALGIEAHSTSIPARDDAAFLRLVVDGTDVQISGGESLDDLILIADSIVGGVATPSSSPSG
jgi:hypothetical protein